MLAIISQFSSSIFSSVSIKALKRSVYPVYSSETTTSKQIVWKFLVSKEWTMNNSCIPQTAVLGYMLHWSYSILFLGKRNKISYSSTPCCDNISSSVRIFLSVVINCHLLGRSSSFISKSIFSRWKMSLIDFYLLIEIGIRNSVSSFGS